MAIFPTLGNQVLPSWFANNDQPFNNSNTLLSVGLGLLSGKTAQDQVGQAASNLYNARQDGRTYNRTLQFLKQNNPDLAQAVEAGALGPADAYKEYYRQKLEAQQPRNSLMAVGKNLYDFQNGQWISPPASIAASDEEWGLTPVWGQDGSGKTVLGQVSKTGKFKPLDTGNFTPTPVIQNIDTGTAIIGRNSRTGAEVTNTPKDVAGAANQKAVGEGQGAATVSLPGATQLATQIDQQINDLKTDPYLPSMVGSVPYTGGMIQRDDLPDRSPESQRVRSKINQLKGGSFLQARQMLKGGGAITDFEGQKADNAFNRMNTAQKLEDFNAALDDFNDAVKAGVAKLQQQSQGNFTGGQPSAAPAAASRTGRTSSGIQFSVEP
ncbi:hypothetical protein IB244_31355 [Rhizobium sp. RHZ02]|uniref:hypothetical protein n=1 Tax=Rhizobium sp. RHZ02 TaxID=2769306 RepID=UPI001782E9EC|nr:hypothetical protein [Rhizobium sp. RHZ02]MBD9455969.1 hypothetical protein [Rhizobium sp. RHZ02]